MAHCRSGPARRRLYRVLVCPGWPVRGLDRGLGRDRAGKGLARDLRRDTEVSGFPVRHDHQDHDAGDRLARRGPGGDVVRRLAGRPLPALAVRPHPARSARGATHLCQRRRPATHGGGAFVEGAGSSRDRRRSGAQGDDRNVGRCDHRRTEPGADHGGPDPGRGRADRRRPGRTTSSSRSTIWDLPRACPNRFPARCRSWPPPCA